MLRPAALLLALSLAWPAMAQERITAYHAELRVLPDASLEVTETISVQAEGAAIRRGIYRDFPTRYRDRRGNRLRVGFEMLAVQRDGQAEAWHQEPRPNGVRVYAGSADHLLAPGEYTYTLRYRTWRQLGHFDGIDELYWNVTGNGWAFPIGHALARVQLPGPVARAALQLAYYTGAQGATGQAATARVEDARTVAFETTAPLAAGEGLTIAVGWPAGLVAVPDRAQRIRWFLADNAGVLAMLGGLLAALAWYLAAWWRVGRDPPRGTVIPRFEPPAGLSPAACSYVRRMGFRNEAFVAALVSLGVKGCLRIEEDGGRFTLRRLPGAAKAPLSAGEQALLTTLLPGAGDTTPMDDLYHREFQAALGALARALKDEHRGRQFRLNGRWAVPAVLLTLVAGAAAIPLGAGPLPWVAFVPAVLALHVVFVLLLRARTPAGRRVMDQVEGFREYLGTAERERLAQMRSPELTPEVFEAFLPYAFALGVENAWCRRLAAELPQAPAAQPGWQPGWYHGSTTNGASGLARLGTGFAGALGGAIAAASTPPGSSSGSGGGGSSGGGGGGGGGGGW